MSALILTVFAAALWYACGFARLLRHSAGGRRTHVRDALRFAGGWLVIALSLLSPLHELGEHSFTAHMIEHELLMLCAALLIAISRPLGVFVWALPHRMRLSAAALGHRGWFNSGWRALSAPLSATILQAIALGVWHAPALFDRALDSEAMHALQHLSLFGSALLFWWSMTRHGDDNRANTVAALCLFFTSLYGGGIGALMSFSSSPWYAQYAALGLGASLPGGLTALEDQQLAGLIMWIPGGAIHAAAALWFFAKTLTPHPRRRATSPARGEAL